MAKHYVVIDTNVIVSALYDENEDSNVTKILRYISKKVIIPLYCSEIIKEYKDILSREEFDFNKRDIGVIINIIKKIGINVNPKKLDVKFKDEQDIKFYEVVMDKRNYDSKLVTGNIKHFPKEPFIVTPKELINIINGITDKKQKSR